MTYVLDTNIILFYLKNGKTKQAIEQRYAPFSPQNTAIISIVTVAEIQALTIKNSWGEKRIAVMNAILERLVVVAVDFAELIEAYAEIDAFSQGKLSGSTPFSARNMGKNDLWIAATAKVAKGTLFTSDQDFYHLEGEQLQIGRVINLDSDQSHS